MPRILQLTDSHLMRRPPVRPPKEFGDAVHLLTGRTSNQATDSVCSKVTETEPPVDLVVHTGDIADDPSVESYELARSLLTSIAPVLVTPGNHDDPALLARVFGTRSALAARNVDLGGWRIIAASSYDEGRHSGTFNDTTLEQLDALLDFDGPVLIGTHHPPISPCSHPDCINDRSAEFLAIIDGHPNVMGVIAGHLHLADEIVRNDVRYLVSPSSALQLDHVHPLPDNNTGPTQAGARLLDLEPDGSIGSKLVWA